MRWRRVAGVLAVALGVSPGVRAQHPRPHHPVEHPSGTLSERPAEPRDPCAEVLHAVDFDDLAAAEEAWPTCRAHVAPPHAIPSADALRTLEDVAEALHGLRRSDGAFCIAPDAPFNLAPALDGHPGDSRGCFEALDRFLRDDAVVLRFLVDDPYAAGRLVVRGGIQGTALRAARGPRRRAALAPPGSPAEREELALARLAGRQFMRVCRCMPGPQPESLTAVRAMHLPDAVEAALLRGITERGDEDPPR